MSSCCRPSDQEYQQLFSTYLNQVIQHNTNMLAHLNQLLTSRLDHMEQALPAFYGNQETLRQEYTAFLQ